jgi:hypothetical protein
MDFGVIPPVRADMDIEEHLRAVSVFTQIVKHLLYSLKGQNLINLRPPLLVAETPLQPPASKILGILLGKEKIGHLKKGERFKAFTDSRGLEVLEINQKAVIPM